MLLEHWLSFLMICVLSILFRLQVKISVNLCHANYMNIMHKFIKSKE